MYNAQFGAAIAAVGDLNQDGFQGKLSNLSLLEERQSSRAASCLFRYGPGMIKDKPYSAKVVTLFTSDRCRCRSPI